MISYRHVLSGFALLLIAPSAMAQLRSGARTTAAVDDIAVPQAQPTPATPTTPSRGAERPGQIADSPVGRPGQRLGRDLPGSGISPTARLSSRITNRVQNRLRTRIDRSYDPRAGSTYPFAVAEDQTRVGRSK